MSDNIKRHAVISDCGRYRYLLSREWETPLLMPSRSCSLAFIMLNPSTADGEVDDPTIRRCIEFAQREGYYGIHVVNLYALRSTDPTEVALARDPGPVGPENDSYIKKICHSCGEVVVAWGAWIFARQRAQKVAEMLPGVALKCLGTNKDGSPRHPLFVPKNTAFVLWGGQ